MSKLRFRNILRTVLPHWNVYTAVGFEKIPPVAIGNQLFFIETVKKIFTQNSRMNLFDFFLIRRLEIGVSILFPRSQA